MSVGGQDSGGEFNFWQPLNVVPVTCPRCGQTLTSIPASIELPDEAIKPDDDPVEFLHRYTHDLKSMMLEVVREHWSINHTGEQVPDRLPDWE
jgi:hypothetical protein